MRIMLRVVLTINIINRLYYPYLLHLPSVIDYYGGHSSIFKFNPNNLWNRLEYNRENETYNFLKRNVHFSLFFHLSKQRHLITV